VVGIACASAERALESSTGATPGSSSPLVPAENDSRNPGEPAWERTPRRSNRLVHRGRGGFAVHACAVADKQVLGSEPCETPRRAHEPQERMNAHRLAARAEERDRAERVSRDEDSPLLPPERDLAPPPTPHHGYEPERRAG
jgi:hypothetical protein